MDDQHHEQRTGSSTQPGRHKPAVTSHRPDLAHQPDDSFLTGRRKAAQRFFHELTYPHNIHPALVPGVSVEDQRIRYRVDQVILTVVGALIVGFIIWGIINPGQVTEVSTAALNWTMLNLGWIFNGSAPEGRGQGRRPHPRRGTSPERTLVPTNTGAPATEGG